MAKTQSPKTKLLSILREYWKEQRNEVPENSDPRVFVREQMEVFMDADRWYASQGRKAPVNPFAAFKSLTLEQRAGLIAAAFPQGRKKGSGSGSSTYMGRTVK